MDISTLALNLTFLMTLGIGFLMFLAHVLIFATILMLARPVAEPLAGRFRHGVIRVRR